jgi:hypothetical protein
MTGCSFTFMAGGFTGLIKYDSSYLGLAIFVLAVISTIYMGKVCQDIDWNKDKPNFNKLEILNRIARVRYAAESCFDLGLLSTIIGLVLMFLGMGNDVSSLIGAIKNGLSTAFIPTLVGMVANFILRLQMFVAEQALEG